MTTHILSAMPRLTNPTINVPLTYPDPPISLSNDVHAEDTYTSTCPRPLKIPLDLSRLFPYNRVSLKELHTPYRALPARGGGKVRCRINTILHSKVPN